MLWLCDEKAFHAGFVVRTIGFSKITIPVQIWLDEKITNWFKHQIVVQVEGFVVVKQTKRVFDKKPKEIYDSLRVKAWFHFACEMRMVAHEWFCWFFHSFRIRSE